MCCGYVRHRECSIEKCRGHLVDMEEETRRELSALQRERELLQAKEKENIDAIDEVSEAGRTLCLLVPRSSYLVRVNVALRTPPRELPFISINKTRPTRIVLEIEVVAAIRTASL